MQLRQLSFLSSFALSFALFSSSWGIATRAENRDFTSPETLLARSLKSSTAKSSVSKATEFSIAQNATEEAEPTDTNPEEATSEEDNPTESAPVETNVEEATPPEDNPTESAPAETNVEEATPPEDNPTESAPAETNVEEATPPEDNPTESAPTEIDPEEVTPEPTEPTPVAPTTSAPVSSAILLQENGTLEEGDATFDSDGSFYDTYTFVGRAGQLVTIDLESQEFDTYLLLVDGEGNTIGENDDLAEGNTNSKLEIELENNSVYTIVVNGFDSEHKGVYNLTAITQLGTGDLQATLTWNTSDDLDLTILDPNEQLVSFDTPLVESGGKLDVDANALCESTTNTPVENIFWPPSNAPKGSYAIAVSLYTRCPDGEVPTPEQAKEPIEFTLTLTVQGTTETFTGTVDEQNNFVTFPTAVY